VGGPGPRRPRGRRGWRDQLPAHLGHRAAIPLPVLRRQRPPHRPGQHQDAAADRRQRQHPELRGRDDPGLRAAHRVARLSLGDRRRAGGGGRVVRPRLLATGQQAPWARAGGAGEPAARRPPAVGPHDRPGAGPAGRDRDRGPARGRPARRLPGRLPPVVHAGAVPRRPRRARPGVRQRQPWRGPAAGRPPHGAPRPGTRPGRGDGARRRHRGPRAGGTVLVHVRPRHPPRRRHRPARLGGHPAACGRRLCPGRPHPRDRRLRCHAPGHDRRDRRLRPARRPHGALPLAGPGGCLGRPRPLAGRPLRAAWPPLGPFLSGRTARILLPP
jgi:hypothetical protein